MTAPAVSLTTITGGISRLRVKGAALKTSLFQLINGYCTMQGTVAVRQGSVRAYKVDSTTKGLAVYKSTFYVFASTDVATPSTPSGVVQRVLVDPNDSTQAIAKIWFAKPFLGFLYVVAQFANGDIFHYWLQSSGTWAPDTVYFPGSIVVPTTGEVLAYSAVRLLPPNSLWTAETSIAVNQIVEPNVATGYYYQATAVSGVSPHTGQVEPTWPTTANATVQEFGDFGTTSQANDSITVTATPLSASITDRYGDSSSIAGQTGSVGASTGTLGSTVAASSTVTTWAAGTLYVPGSVVQPSTSQGAFIDAIPNGDFEAGTSDWTFNTPWGISSSGPYQGTQCAEYTSDAPFTADLIMTNPGTVTPGQSVTATGYIQGDSDSTVQIKLYWYDSSDTKLSETDGAINGGANIAPHYALGTVAGNAPANAVGVRVAFTASTGSLSARGGRVDLVSWNLETPTAVSNFLYEAVQAQAGTSASTEPTWPTTEGDTVTDGGVTWQAVGSSIITWTAYPIMESGASEPAWPLTVGLSVADGNMTWTATDRRITDKNCPQTNIVCIGASHVFCGDNDIVAYSAAVNPTDWSSSNNAGYLPTGLNDYGDNPVAQLGLYRSNLMVINSGGYQMWQIDPDPTNMAILDAEPVSCASGSPRAGQPANDDYVFLTPAGIRNVGTAGVAGNLQAGNFGKQVDAIVTDLLAQLPSGVDPLGMFSPGTGQYLLFFGSKALVLTINGTSAQMSWSQFQLPYVVTDWAILGDNLYVRTTDPTAGDLILEFTPSVLVDDFGTAANGIASLGTITGGTLYTAGSYAGVPLTGGSGTGATADITVAGGAVTAVDIVDGGIGYVGADSLSALAANIGGTGSGFLVPVVNTGVLFTGTVWYQYLDLGPIGLEKMMEGFDLSIDGTMTLSVGYNQKDTTQVTDGYAIDGDTLDQAGCIPFPVSAPTFQIRLEIDANQQWEIQVLNIYIVTENKT